MKNIHHYKNKKLVNNVFDNVYQNYDLMNDIMSLVVIDYGKRNS